MQDSASVVDRLLGGKEERNTMRSERERPISPSLVLFVARTEEGDRGKIWVEGGRSVTLVSLLCWNGMQQRTACLGRTSEEYRIARNLSQRLPAMQGWRKEHASLYLVLQGETLAD